MQGYNSVLNHDKLIKTISVMDELVLWKVESGVNVAQKVACEFTASFEISIIEQVEEVLDKVTEQGVN